jgi:pyrroloquinoline quinone (PQQ) biosynthesis protein C
MAAGRQISLDLWPFIVRLPCSIKVVMEKLPPALEPARLFLGNLVDEERSYQDLYIKQCSLAGLSSHDLITSEGRPTPATAALVAALHEACVDGDVLSGAQAIVAAELAATQFARSVLEAFETYFLHHQGEYEAERVEEGLAWVRLHTKTNTRQAIWMNRMLFGLGEGGAGQGAEGQLPPAVKSVLGPIFELWQVQETTRQSWL